MPRIRTVKPEMHGDGTSGRLSDTAFRLLVGLLNFADDVGVNLLDVGEIHARIFPYKKSEAGTEKALEELRVSEITIHFTMGNGKAYVYIVNFLKHQKIDRPSQPMIPGWEPDETLDDFRSRTDQLDLFGEGSPNTRRGLDEGSTLKGKERKGKEEKKPENIKPSERLTEVELEALALYCGDNPMIVKALLEELDDYWEQTNKFYKSIPATVRSWYRRKRDEGKLPAATRQAETKPQGPREKPSWEKPPKAVRDLARGIGKEIPPGDEA